VGIKKPALDRVGLEIKSIITAVPSIPVPQVFKKKPSRVCNAHIIRRNSG
jgi:hypothetical protein